MGKNPGYQQNRMDMSCFLNGFYVMNRPLELEPASTACCWDISLSTELARFCHSPHRLGGSRMRMDRQHEAMLDH